MTLEKMTLNSKLPPLIFIWIGDSLPKWAHISLQLSVSHSKVEVILLCSNAIKLSIDGLAIERLEDFYSSQGNTWIKNIEKLTPKYRNGFWIKTTERFLVLRDYAKYRSIKKLFHAELDNLVFDLSDLSGRLDDLGHGFFCPRDQIDRGIASLVYINDTNMLDELAISIYSGDIKFENDMKLLGYLLNTHDNFYSLPNERAINGIEPSNWPTISAMAIGGITDAAAIGQYILGIDPKNAGIILRNGYENINIGCNFKNLHFDYDVPQGRFKITDRTNKKEYNLYNLHIHSKLFSKILNTSGFKKLLAQLNAGKMKILLISLHRNKIFRAISYRLLNR
jgi:hypothetical protein